MSGVAKHVAPDWSPGRERAVRDGLHRALARRKRRQVTTTAVSALVVLVGALVFWSRAVAPKHGAAVAVKEAVVQPLVRFEDGSTVSPIGADARVEPVEVNPDVVSTRLAAGAARFSVTPNPKRVFRVLARDVTVTVLGTIFTVAIEPGDVRVRVERGSVRVTSPTNEHDLGVGEEVVVLSSTASVALPPAPDTAERDSLPEAAASAGARERAEAARVVHHGAPVAPHPERSWRELAQEGDYAAAFASMAHDGDAVRDDPEDLLLAADVARLGGHPEKAVTPLSKVVSAHADDSRAPLAAFTLGRTLLDQLGRPREAAEAFATARKLAPHGALTQDALAREVESWQRAGETTLAHDRATEYVERYPKGRRLAAVRRLGGLE
jgi:transmembrane sensor